jgi:hypothetical protein
MHNVATPCSPEFSNIRGSPGGKQCAIVQSGKKPPAIQKNVFTSTTVSSQTEYLQVIWMNSGFLRSYAQIPFHAFPNETKHSSLLQNPRLTLRRTHPPIQRVRVSFTGSYAAGA